MASGVLRVNVDLERGNTAACDAISGDLSRQLDSAVNGLGCAYPQYSAASPTPAWQAALTYAAVGFIPYVMLSAFLDRGGTFAALLTVPFVLIILIRFAALWFLVMPSRRRSSPPPILDDENLPAYSVLVPLYREHKVAPALVEALISLDYPFSKLEIIFVTEENDPATRFALTAAKLPAHMRVVTVPAGNPQTKPRALNYALQSARGELLAVYDAEDVPSPRQLRLAAEKFAASPDDLACVQARLSIYNPDDGILTRQFTLEYASLFEAILPALERLGLPILLGGTSNHFRRSHLIEVGAWDAFNVTEDADLGVRLIRFGKHVALLDSDTWEEAPSTWRDWRGQRTRWLKGWMQTFDYFSYYVKAI